MKVLKVSGVVLLALVVGISAYAAQTLYRLDLLVNPINRYLYLELPFLSGPRVQLIPEVFAFGMPRSEVEKRLLAAGFEPTDTDHPFAGRSCPATDFDGVTCAAADGAREGLAWTGGGRTMYVREAARIPCNFQWYVYVKSNADNEVFFVDAAAYESGCL